MDKTPTAGRTMPETPIRQEILHCLLTYNSRLPRQQRLTRAALESRTNLVLAVIREAWNLGHLILKPQNVGLALATKVVSSWRQRGLSRTTMSLRWAALRYFAIAIGKAGMLPPLEHLWPAAEKEEPAATPRRTLAHLTGEQYQRLLAELPPSEPTHWVVRLERELDLTRRQALATNFVIGSSRVPGMLIASDEGGQKTRAVPLTDANRKELLSQILEYLAQRHREKLCWPRTSIAAAQKKVANAVAYQLSKMDLNNEGACDE